MRLQLGVALLALVGVAAGGWLIGRVALGAAVIFDSLAVGAFALLWDRAPAAAAPDEQTLYGMLDRARRAA